MAFFENVYNQIFGSKNQTRPEIRELIHRSDRFKEKYEYWKERNTAILKRIYTSYVLQQKGIAQSPSVSILNSPYSNGFAVSFAEDFPQDEFSYLLDWWKDKTLDMGYKCVNYDRTIRDEESFIKTVEKAYLKPQLSTSIPIHQQYGNILIESIKYDNRPIHIKITASIYSDRTYTEALPFYMYLKNLST